MKRKAFTLVELLVVIGIIALLISILMPSLSRARAAAEKVSCASNLRQVYMGWFMYLQDNDGRHPRIREHLGSGQTSATWIHKLVGCQGNNTSVSISSAVTQYVHPRVLICPRDSWPLRETSGPAAMTYWGWNAPSWIYENEEGRASYGYYNTKVYSGNYNIPIIADSVHTGPSGSDRDKAGYYPKFFVKNLKQPGEWPLFYDSDFFCSDTTMSIKKETTPRGAPNSTSLFYNTGRARHNNRMNVVYADGHVGDAEAGSSEFKWETMWPKKLYVVEMK